MDLEEGMDWRKYPIDLSQFLHVVQSVKHMQVHPKSLHFSTSF